MNETRKCSNCQLEFNKDNFIKGQSRCKICRKAYKDAYYSVPENKEHAKKKKKIYNDLNRKNKIVSIIKLHEEKGDTLEKQCSFCFEIKKLSAFYAQETNKCKECHSLYNKERSKIPGIKEKRKIRVEKYMQMPEVKEHYRLYRNKYYSNKYHTIKKYDPNFNIRSNISRSIRAHLEKQKIVKKGSCLEYLDYSIPELKANLEKLFSVPENLDKNGNVWMTWENYGKYDPKTHDNNPTWQIDHIIPHSEFNYDSMDHPEFKKCWAISNLRPLDSRKNLLDGVHRTRHKKLI